MQLREQLIQLRDKYGLSQQEFADRVGVSRQSVSRWESGKSVPSAKQAAALCAAFRLNAKAFLNGRIEEEGAEADAAADLTAGSAEGAAGAANTTGAAVGSAEGAAVGSAEGAAVGSAPAADTGEDAAGAGEHLQGLSRRKTRRLLLIALGVLLAAGIAGLAATIAYAVKDAMYDAGATVWIVVLPQNTPMVVLAVILCLFIAVLAALFIYLLRRKDK